MENMSRRKFLKFGGACVAGVGAVVASKGTAMAANTKDFRPHPDKQEGKLWGMVIDMTKMEDLQACVDACHKFHNVPNIDTKKDEVKWLWGDTFEHAFMDDAHERLSEKYKGKEIALLCNHCESPVCVRVCPTKATFQNAQGVTLMDMHRCIGCRNCMAACPYGARSFNFKDPRPFIEEINPTYPTRMKGVVEKCNFCAERLAVGEWPLCVEASNGAIVFGDLNDPKSTVSQIIAEKFTLQRKVSLGTKPKVYYIV